MWWWRKIRKANIPKDARDLFERYGEFIIGSALASGHSPGANELRPVYHPGPTQDHAKAWLTERGDAQHRREDRLETVEVAILAFVIIGVMVDILLMVWEFAH